MDNTMSLLVIPLSSSRQCPMIVCCMVVVMEGCLGIFSSVTAALSNHPTLQF